jgi:hypothetical protein
MICPIDANLFEDYASAVMELFDATDRLANLVGQHGPFEDERKYAEQVRGKCSVARLAWSNIGHNIPVVVHELFGAALRTFPRPNPPRVEATVKGLRRDPRFR